MVQSSDNSQHGVIGMDIVEILCVCVCVCGVCVCVCVCVCVWYTYIMNGATINIFIVWGYPNLVELIFSTFLHRLISTSHDH